MWADFSVNQLFWEIRKSIIFSGKLFFKFWRDQNIKIVYVKPKKEFVLYIALLKFLLRELKKKIETKSTWIKKKSFN